MSNDMWASLLIASAWILLALGVAHGKDAAKALWAMRPGFAMPHPWIRTLADEQADHVASRAWSTWPLRIGEVGDD